MRIPVPAAQPAATPPADDEPPPCATDTALFLHPLLEDLDEVPADGAAAHPGLGALLDRARAACAACVRLPECMYAAVVTQEVSGFVGCTTPAERARIRDRVGARPVGEDLDSAAGVRGERRPLDHEALLAARAAYPDDSLEMLANRLECSLSTVKRHLRRARREAAGVSDPDPPRPRTAGVPTVADVLDAFDDVVQP